MSENNRQFPREEIHIEVELKFLNDETRTVITRDVSQGGLFLRLKNSSHYPMGEMLNLRFKHPLENYQETVKDGIIVRRGEQGIAVAFIEMEEF